MVFFDLDSEFPLLRGVERQLLFIPETGFNTLTSKDYGRTIPLFDSSIRFRTKPDPTLYDSSSLPSAPYTRLWLEGVVFYIQGNPDSQFLTLNVEAQCESALLRVKINAYNLANLGMTTPNTLSPYLLRYGVPDPDNNPNYWVIVAIYDPEPILGIQKNLKLTLEVPSSKSHPSIPDLDTIPIQYQVALLFKWITDEKAYLESRAAIYRHLLGDINTSSTTTTTPATKVISKMPAWTYPSE
jgi:hypothetical protein